MVALLVEIESAGIPVPGETTLVLAAIYAGVVAVLVAALAHTAPRALHEPPVPVSSNSASMTPSLPPVSRVPDGGGGPGAGPAFS